MRIALNGHCRTTLDQFVDGDTFILKSNLYMKVCTYTSDAKALFNQFRSNKLFPVVRLSTGEFEFLPGESEVEPIKGYFQEGDAND